MFCNCGHQLEKEHEVIKIDDKIQKKCKGCTCIISEPIINAHVYDTIEDLGQRITLPSGMITEKKDKQERFDLIPAEPLARLAKIYGLGAQKYDDNNWKNGNKWSACLNSLERHLNKWKSGKNNEDHLAMIAWRAFALMYYEIYHPEMCDIEERKNVT